jgi:uncharacterized cupin superfamily protein
MAAAEPARPQAPLTLDAVPTRLRVTRREAPFRRDGLRAGNEYRDLGIAAATGGRIGIKHVRAVGPLKRQTGWHWHDLAAHIVYVLKGWLAFRLDGHPDEVRLHAGDCISQPAGVPHNVVARSDDLEVIEINLPASYGTFELER